MGNSPKPTDRYNGATAGVVRGGRVKLTELQLEDVIEGRYQPPLTLKDFEDYLAFKVSIPPRPSILPTLARTRAAATLLTSSPSFAAVQTKSAENLYFCLAFRRYDQVSPLFPPR